MKNDIKKLFCEKNAIEKNLNDIKMKILLSGCDNSKSNGDSDEYLESPFKKMADMIKDAAVGLALILWGLKWLSNEKVSALLKVIIFIVVDFGFSICVCSICWFLINLFKIKYIKSKKNERISIAVVVVISFIITSSCISFGKKSFNNEKIGVNIYNCEQVK